MLRYFLTFSLLLVFFSCSNSDDAPQSMSENPSMEVTNTSQADLGSDDFLGVGDIVTFTITLENTGNTELESISIEYNLNDLAGNSRMFDGEIVFESSTNGSLQGSLMVGETATYSATYTIVQEDVDAGGISNSITASATSSSGEVITDISDNGNDTDGNLLDDLTIVSLSDPPIDPTIIAEFHILNSSGNPRTRFIFDQYGEIQRIINNSGITSSHGIYDFTFDSENRLSNVTKYDLDENSLYSKDIVYDSSGRIVSFGEQYFEFFGDDTGYYVDLQTVSNETYTIDNIEYVEYSDQRYNKSENPLLAWCSYFYTSELNLTTGELTEYEYCLDFSTYDYVDENIAMHCTDADCMNFSFDSMVNPLKSETNLINVYAIIDFLSGNYNPLLNLFTENNLVGIDGSDPGYWIYNYTYNENDLPSEVLGQYYYAGGPDGESYIYSRYYYQGDEIPD